MTSAGYLDTFNASTQEYLFLHAIGWVPAHENIRTCIQTPITSFVHGLLQ